MGGCGESGLEGIERYNRINKVQTMQRALRELGVSTWFAGGQAGSGKHASRTARTSGQGRAGVFQIAKSLPPPAIARSTALRVSKGANSSIKLKI
ncbi:Phosphoadenosine phosphosulfate reductase [Thiorhodovibrio litoralis]|nr:Phosphoadenosine phosphosulfate reductase [Thiorhodovibrio litoralis]